jgi:hypothetical protein
MRAAFYTQQGWRQRGITDWEVPAPEPSPGELRVRLQTSGVN